MVQTTNTTHYMDRFFISTHIFFLAYGSLLYVSELQPPAYRKAIGAALQVSVLHRIKSRFYSKNYHILLLISSSYPPHSIIVMKPKLQNRDFQAHALKSTWTISFTKQCALSLLCCAELHLCQQHHSIPCLLLFFSGIHPSKLFLCSLRLVSS